MRKICQFLFGISCVCPTHKKKSFRLPPKKKLSNLNIQRKVLLIPKKVSSNFLQILSLCPQDINKKENWVKWCDPTKEAHMNMIKKKKNFDGFVNHSPNFSRDRFTEKISGFQVWSLKWLQTFPLLVSPLVFTSFLFLLLSVI